MKQLLRDLNIWPQRINILRVIRYDRNHIIKMISHKRISVVCTLCETLSHNVHHQLSRCYVAENKGRWLWLSQENLYKLIEDGVIEVL